MSRIYDAYEVCYGVWEVMDKIPFPPELVKFARTTQDPELMLVDGDRIGEYIDAYENIEFSDEGRFALMFVILDSFNDMVVDNDPDFLKHWGNIKRLLMADDLFYSKLVIYYASVDRGKDLEDAWPIAPYMRFLLIDIAEKYEYIKVGSDTPFLADWDYLPGDCTETPREFGE